MDVLRRLDDRLLVQINDFARSTGWLHQPLLAYAKYGVVLFAVFLAAGLWLARRDSARRLAAAAWACLGTLLAVALNQPLGHAVHEARPYVSHPHLLVLASPTLDFSFPSDHAVMAGAVTAGVFLVSRRLGGIAAVAALLIAFARVYIATHYPWDVVAGLAFGAAVVLVGWVVFRIPLTALAGWLRRQPGLRTAFGDVANDRSAPAGSGPRR
jgi:membrane-associated phospholipid phosphatase